MRISDWSSDVCSSDLPREHCQGAARPAVRGWAGASTPAGARAHPAPRLADRSALAGGALSLPGTGRTARADARSSGVPEFLVGGEVGRASSRERVGQYVYISVVAGALKTKKDKNK